MNNLYQHLELKFFTKLILGLGNTSLQEIEALGRIYSSAGVDMFDLTPDKEVFNALTKGIKKQGNNPEDYFYCLSFSFGEDVHGSKAEIDKANCTKCGKCMEKCPYEAIEKDILINSDKCIGCRECSFCENIKYVKTVMEPVSVLKELIKNFKIDMVELHVNGVEKEKIIEYVKEINTNYPETDIGICLSRGKRDIVETKAILKEVRDYLYPKKLIFQADGISMSGIKNQKETAMYSIEYANEFDDIEKIYKIISGGCNSNTKKLIKESQVNINGIAYGSYARNLVKTYVKKSDFCYNIEIINEAIKTAKEIRE